MNNNMSDPNTINYINHNYNRFQLIKVPIPDSCLTIKQEIFKIIEKLKNRKSSGEDKITKKVLKNLPLDIIDQLVLIFNACIKKQHFTNSWKNAIILPIKKLGKPDNLTINYRPISLLPILAKIFEKIILKRLQTKRPLWK